MKHFCLALLFALLHFLAKAQPADQPSEKLDRFQIAVDFSDMIMTRFGADFMIYLGGRQAFYVGGGGLSGSVQTKSGFLNSEYEKIRGNYYKIGHRFYLEKEKRVKGFFLQHGPIWQNSKIRYYKEVWRYYQEDGLNYISFLNTKFWYPTKNFGYDLELGFRFGGKVMGEMAMGAGYREKISSQKKPEGYSLKGPAFGVDYTGWRFVATLKLGYAF